MFSVVNNWLKFDIYYFNSKVTNENVNEAGKQYKRRKYVAKDLVGRKKENVYLFLYISLYSSIKLALLVGQPTMIGRSKKGVY